MNIDKVEDVLGEIQEVNDQVGGVARGGQGGPASPWGLCKPAGCMRDGSSGVVRDDGGGGRGGCGGRWLGWQGGWRACVPARHFR